MTQLNKPLPLVPGCMAIVTKSANLGKMVIAQELIEPGKDYRIPGDPKVYQGFDCDAGHWLCLGKDLGCWDEDKKEAIKLDAVLIRADMLMRIDGNNDAFSSQDISIYQD